jgi:hypothetical protein
VRPPASIVVGPHVYRVVMVPAGVLADSGSAGTTNPQALTIAVCEEQARSQLADTLLHELAHALVASVGLDEDVEERVCLALGPGLLGLLRGNPELVAYVTARDSVER